MFPAWTWICGLLIGAAIGSFLNVVIYRLPRGISLSNPKNSFCPNCKHQLSVLDLFPLFSWLFLRGRCRYCKAKVSSRYFFVELITGSIWAGIWYEYLVLGNNPAVDVAKAFAFAFTAAALVAVIFIDWELYIIPDQINAAILVFGLAYNGWLIYRHEPEAWTWGIPSSIAGALIGIAVLWGIAFFGRVIFRKDAMGHGDIKMARGIGAVLFPATAIASFGIAVFLGAVLGVLQVLIRGRVGTTNVGASNGEEGDAVLEEEQEEDYPPESISSLLKSGVGYVLCFDIIGLFVPSFYKTWYGEDPFEPISEATGFEVERTMIPFGPYLALGAIVATVFQSRLMDWIHAYWHWATRGAA